MRHQKWTCPLFTVGGRKPRTGKGDRSIFRRRVWEGSESAGKNRPVPFSGFTLFEVILSVALAAVLLALISTAVNLYLTRIDSDRTRVEEAQLAGACFR